ncbi:outer membrane protein assembly factor BamB [Herbaspirillum rubrisubalbicans]|uniref:outer membrane protein assembly factor BamB family protein n=1 Tax=Herbaspirillum rubrisubalbicans TaxID=80842 RepID=UPI00209F7981|nr:PQQ-binding-like beta-propeller repeat protein [Herbaspirillum rubrisubalbicans]MCP1573953.1 outer membrane protein assembly factor BamB [Herbaspirillum rubrisubalbicans]
MSEKKQALLSAIRSEAVLTSDGQRLISPTGTSNRWLIDMRRIFMKAVLLDLLAEFFWDEYSEKLPFQVGGMETAAIPLLSAILLKSAARGTPVNGFIVRKERKTYGTGNLIEGVLTEEPIIIVDDVLNSGNSLEKVRVILERERREISSIFVLIDYRSTQGLAWRAAHDLQVHSLFALNELNLSLKKEALPASSTIFRNQWSFRSPDPNFFHRVPKSFPVVDNGRLYFGGDCGIFWCLDAFNGKPIWAVKVESVGHKNIWSTAAVHRGRVYFGSYDGNVYCLDAATGQEIWRFIGADWVGSSPSLGADIGLLFIGLEFGVEGKRGSVVALDMETGEKVWEHMTTRYTHASPIYWAERGIVACGSNDDELLLLDARSGDRYWRFRTNKSGASQKGSIRHAAAFDKRRGHVVTGCADGCIYIVDVASGEEVWSVTTSNTIYTIPLIVGDLAFVPSSDKHLYILDLEKKELKKKIFCGSKLFSPPSLINGKIYFGSCGGLLYELSLESLSVTGTHQLPDAITNMVSYSQETKFFYVLTYVNELFAIDAGRAT